MRKRYVFADNGKKIRSKDYCQRVVYFISHSGRNKALVGVDCEVSHDPSEIAHLYLMLALVKSIVIT